MADSIGCPSCGKRFAWKPELAGRKVACKCGNVFIASPPTGAQGEDDYDLAPDPADANVKPQMADAAPAASVHVAPTPAARPASAFPAPRMRQVVQEDDDFSPFREIYLPITFIAVGLAIWIGHLLFAPQPVIPKPMAQQIGLMVCTVILCVAIMLAGVAVSAQILSINFGSMGLAVLKLTAIAILAGGIFTVIAALDKDKFSITGMAVAYNIVIILYWWLFSVFFNLELQENLLTVGIVIFMQSIGVYALYTL